MAACFEIVYLFGCDTGGWHNEDKAQGDTLAVCKWDGRELKHVEATAEVSYFPNASDSIVNQLLQTAKSEQAKNCCRC